MAGCGAESSNSRSGSGAGALQPHRCSHATAAPAGADAGSVMVTWRADRAMPWGAMPAMFAQVRHMLEPVRAKAM